MFMFMFVFVFEFVFVLVFEFVLPFVFVFVLLLPPPATQANVPDRIVVVPFITVIVVPSEIPLAESTFNCALPLFGTVI